MRDLPLLSLLLTAVEATATIAFALSGLLEAARKRLDAVGVCVVAGLAAFGGGTLRDVLFDRRPFFWVEHAPWLWVLLALCVAAMGLLRARHFAPTEKAMQWPDALGLGLFSASGTQLALAQDMARREGTVIVMPSSLPARLGRVSISSSTLGWCPCRRGPHFVQRLQGGRQDVVGGSGPTGSCRCSRRYGGLPRGG